MGLTYKSSIQCLLTMAGFVFHTGWHWNFVYKTMTGVQHTRMLTRMQHTTIMTCVQHTNSYSREMHEVWLACFLLTCSTQCISHAAHKIYFAFTTQILLTSSTFRVTRKFWLSDLTKLKTTRVLGTCDVNLDVSCTVATQLKLSLRKQQPVLLVEWVTSNFIDRRLACHLIPYLLLQSLLPLLIFDYF